MLVHFLPSIAFIQAELDKGRGVLVHCQAGMSPSLNPFRMFSIHIHLRCVQEAAVQLLWQRA